MSGADHAERLVRTWAQHLRSGGSTPWAAWPAVAPASSGDVLTGPLPGAAQLEVVRRLAAARDRLPGRLEREDFTCLADTVLSGSGPGRGLGELPVTGPDLAPAGFGPRAVDPADVPEEELIRVCVGVLADLLPVTVPPPVAAPGRHPRRRPRRRRPWRRAFRLVGAPDDVESLRTSLAARGLVEGGRSPRVLVVGTDVEAMMRQVWTARVRAGGDTRWQRLWSRAAGRDTLPVRIDLPRVADHWARRVGAHKVHLVLGRDLDSVHCAAGEALGLPDLAVHIGHPAVPPWSSASVDLLRRLNAVLNIRLDLVRADALRDGVLPDLLADSGDGQDDPLRAPDRYREWSRGRAAGIAKDLATCGYAVHGSLEDLAPGIDDASPGTPVRTDVLAVAIRACLRAAGAEE